MAKPKREPTCSFRIGRDYYRMQPGTNGRDHLSLRSENGVWQIMSPEDASEVAKELIRRAELILVK